jgi:hypothetical protein
MVKEKCKSLFLVLLLVSRHTKSQLLVRNKLVPIKKKWPRSRGKFLNIQPIFLMDFIGFLKRRARSVAGPEKSFWICLDKIQTPAFFGKKLGNPRGFPKLRIFFGFLQ